MAKVCLVCDLIWSLTLILGCAYLVFSQGASGWWFVLAIFLCSGWSCKSYREGSADEA